METEILENVTTNVTDNCNINIDANMEAQEFDYQDDSQVDSQTDQKNNQPEEELKYTKIDCLDEDPPISGQRFACMSFISPEGLMNCKVRGFKLRGVYGSYDEARVACAKFQKMDKYFDVYVAEIGKWCPWDPTPEQIKETIYPNKTENKIMKSLQEKEMENLNEIVGRQKEKIDKSKVSHKKRMAESIKKNVASLDESQDVNKEDEKTKEEKIDRASGRKPPAKSQRGQETVRERLRKLVDQREKAKAENSSHTKMYVTDNYTDNDTSNKPNKLGETFEERQTKVKLESQRIKEKEDNTNKLKQVSAESNEKVAKLKEYLNQKKQEKQAHKQ